MGVYFPAQVDLKVNVTATSGKFPGVTLVNKEGVSLRNLNAGESLPATRSTPPPAGELVDRVLVKIDSLDTALTFVPARAL
ncbi:hypothetical protein [Herbidospora sp. RD11066]